MCCGLSHAREYRNLQHHQIDSRIAVENNPTMPVATFTSTHKCIIPNSTERARLRRDAIAIGDRMNTLRFLARSPGVTHDQVDVSAAKIAGFSLSTPHRWRYHHPTDGDLLALQSTIDNGHRLVRALTCLTAPTPMSALNTGRHMRVGLPRRQHPPRSPNDSRTAWAAVNRLPCRAKSQPHAQGSTYRRPATSGG